jgi:uncharacterized protein (TIGR02099 family)
MRPDQYNSAPATSRFAGYWRLIRQGYGYANIATHHTLGAVLKLLVVVYFIFCALFLTLRYGVLPNIDRYKGDVEQIASRTIGSPVSIGTIYASWKGLRPYLFLGGVVIHDRNGREALSLPGVEATFSWWSALVADVRLHSLAISRPDLDIQRDTNGKLFVAGIFIDTEKNGDGKGADWVLAQNEIVIREGRVRWNDHQRDAPELVLDGVNVLLRNQWQRHQFALKATPPIPFAAPLDLRADFVHPHFAQRISDIRQWRGELYADLHDTDLAIWKTYVDYPIEVQQGKGAVRAWLNFDHARVADFTADLTLSNVSARLRKDLQPMNLAHVSGRVSVREELGPPSSKVTKDISSFGAHGHAISLTDFSMQTEDGMVLPTTTISETFIPAKKGQPEKTEIKAKLLDLHMLAEFVERLPLPAAQRQMLADFSPRGRLKDFSAQWQGAYPDISSYAIKGQFAGLSLQAQAARPARPKSAKAPAQAAVPAIPGFENLTGQVDANDRGGAFRLASKQLKLDLPGYFVEPSIVFDQLNMQAKWAFQENDQLLLEVAKLDFTQPGLSGSLSGRHLMPLAAHQGKPLGTIDLTGHISKFDIKQIGSYLPVHTPEHLQDWLTGGLQEGTANDVNIRLKGNLADFPFHTDTPNAKPKGEFRISGKIENGKLNYAPGRFAKDGKAPLWPELEAIDGSIALDRTRIDINAKSARTHGLSLSNVKASIPDVLSSNLQLNVDGDAAGPLQGFVGYTVNSPVADWIGHFTDETKAGGNARLALKLQLPLMHLADAKVQGSLQFAGNDVSLQNAMPPLLATSGKLEFNERGLNLNGIKANFLGGPVAVLGGTQRDGSIVIKAEGTMSAAGLRKTYASPAMQRLSDRINGSTRYSASVSVKKSRPEIVVESSLQGLAIDFPAPLNKKAGESMPLKFELGALAADDAATMRDEIKLSLGSAIAARYQRQKSPDKDAAWQVVRGGIGVNVPAPQPESGLIVNVNMKSLSIDAWSKAVTSIIGSDKQKAATTAGTSDALNLSQYIDPEVLAARATELYVVGKKLDNVVVGASHQKGVWQANIDSEQASGYVTWDESVSGQGLGKVSARLVSLTIPQSAASEVTDLLEGKHASAQIPGLDIVAENFELFGKKLGHLELIASNALTSATREWHIDKLTLTNGDAQLKASGKWSAKEGESNSSLNYALDIGNAGRLLDRLGFSNVLRGGKGKMDGDINWKGMPFALDIPSLSGQVKLELAAGQFLKVDPGAAKLLGVLNLQALPRRLVLDFRDVFSDGFAFDGIAATANIAQGVAKTDNFKMRSVNATVLMDGSADIGKESQNLHVAVIPEINAGAASVVYALAVNPVIGVGTFLAQLFLREPLMRAFTFEYNVTGSWKDPVVTKLERKAENSPKPIGSAADSTEKAG